VQAILGSCGFDGGKEDGVQDHDGGVDFVDETAELVEMGEMVFLLPWIEVDLHVSGDTLDAFQAWLRYGTDFAIVVTLDLRIVLESGVVGYSGQWMKYDLFG
jgi:hypothetical protein